MWTCVIASQKGGSGKTTLALNLAVIAAANGKSVVVADLDPQQSAARWSRIRDADLPLIVDGRSTPIREIATRAESGGADILIIDTAPKSERAAVDAARIANLILIPCQPSSLDLDAIGDSANIAAMAQRPAVFVLNNCRAATTLTADAAEALSTYALPIAPQRIGGRVAFIKSLAEGKGVVETEPNSLAAAEMRALWKFITKKGNM
jgi:chromosome partitioning protein